MNRYKDHPKVKMATFEMPRPLDKEARVQAAILDISKSELIRRALVAYLGVVPEAIK